MIDRKSCPDDLGDFPSKNDDIHSWHILKIILILSLMQWHTEKEIVI